MKQLRYAVFVLGFVVMFALAGCAGNTQDLAALTPESEAGAGETVAETPITEGGEATPETAGEMGPVEPTAAGEAAMAEPTTAGEAIVVEPTTAAEAAVADPTVVPEVITEPTAAGEAVTAEAGVPTTAPTTAAAAATVAPTQAAATVAPTQAAATSQPTTPAEEGTSTGSQSQIVTISADGSLSPSSISVDPGTRLSLTMVNLSSNAALLMVNVGNASSGINIPAAAQTEDNTGLTLTPQDIFVQFDQAGTYEIACSQGCSGSISIEVGGGASAEPATTPTE